MPGVDLPVPFEAYTGNQPYIFVSYAHADGKSVYPEIAALRKAGYRIWYDEGVDPGNEWTEDIAKALEGAQCFVVFISHRAIESRNVRNEILFALNHNKLFIPIYLADVALPPGLELSMSLIQAVHRWRITGEQFHRKLSKVLPMESLALSEEPQAAQAIAETAHLPTFQSVPATPFLLLGLGGTGHEIVCNLKRSLSLGGELWRNSIRLFIVDSDRRYFKTYRRKSVLDDYEVIFISKEGTGMDGIRESALPALFFSVNSFLARIKHGMVSLGCVPSQEHQDEFASPRLHVLVIASLAGGTGSGLFLEMPGLIEMAASVPCTFSAILVMPWIFREWANYGYANTYAALLELAHLMDVKTVPMTISYEKNITTRTRVPIYDTAYLVDAFIEDGSYVSSPQEMTVIIANGILPVLNGEDSASATLSFGAIHQQLHTVVVNQDGFIGSISDLAKLREEYKSAKIPLHTNKFLTKKLARRYRKQLGS